MNASPHQVSTTMMTAEEARKRVNAINSGMNNLRAQIVDFHDRKGWAALGYENWADCVQKEFSIGQSHVYRLFEAAKIEERINENSPIGEKSIPESQLRPLAAVAEDEQKTVYHLAKETAPEGKLTAAHVEKTVREIRGEFTDVCHGCPDHRRRGNQKPGVTLPGVFGKCIREGGPCEKPQPMSRTVAPRTYAPGSLLKETSDAMLLATAAIEALERIPKNDPQRKAAIAKVAEWCWRQRQPDVD